MGQMNMGISFTYKSSNRQTYLPSDKANKTNLEALLDNPNIWLSQRDELKILELLEKLENDNSKEVNPQ